MLLAHAPQIPACRQWLSEHHDRLPTWLALATVALVMLGLIGLPAMSTASIVIGHTLLAAYSMLLIATAVHGHCDALRAALSWRPLCFVGRISYGVYLLHMPVALLTMILLGVPLSATVVAIAFCATLAIASLSFFAFEQPITRYARRWRYDSGHGQHTPFASSRVDGRASERASAPNMPSSGAQPV
jgi:peptidoglycan/LPS O-acetylase OafA/YrhL